jgi:hypothetical protein
LHNLAILWKLNRFLHYFNGYIISIYPVPTVGSNYCENYGINMLKDNFILFCSPGWPLTLNPPVSASQVLSLQDCTTISAWQRDKSSHSSCRVEKYYHKICPCGVSMILVKAIVKEQFKKGSVPCIYLPKNKTVIFKSVFSPCLLRRIRGNPLGQL